MKNTLLSKTLTASLPGHPHDIYALISDPQNLPSWNSAFCRSIRVQGCSLIAETPRGAVAVRFIRDDRSFVLDLLMEVIEGIELNHAIRVLSNGEGSEVIWTLIKPEGVSDSIFHEHLRWAGSALHNLRKAPAEWPAPPQGETVAATPAEPGEVSPLESSANPADTEPLPVTGRKLFIGNLSYDWTDDQLRTHFAEAGAVTTAEVARFRGRNGRSRGFGFVEMTTEAEAQVAIEKLHGGMAGGRQIIVRLAKSQENRAPRENSAAPAVETPADAPEPGNELVPPARPSRQRSQRARPPSRTPPSRAPGGRSRGPQRTYVTQDISNSSGYEIFPRRAKGAPASETPRESIPPRSRPVREASSPYMEDTGDIENRGGRPPRHRRRPDSSR